MESQAKAVLAHVSQTFPDNGARQAIVTKYLGPTNSRGSRVKATAQAGSVTIPWDHEFGAEDNHVCAAHALAEKFGWLEWTDRSEQGSPVKRFWVRGATVDGYVFVSSGV